MREAINASNLKALFNLFYQYCSLVKDICKFCPDLLVRCVKYFTVCIFIENFNKI